MSTTGPYMSDWGKHNIAKHQMTIFIQLMQ
jgi:hypothetical protein